MECSLCPHAMFYHPLNSKEYDSLQGLSCHFSVGTTLVQPTGKAVHTTGVLPENHLLNSKEYTISDSLQGLSCRFSVATPLVQPTGKAVHTTGVLPENHPLNNS